MRKYPPELEIRPLSKDEWNLVAETFETRFGNAMPDSAAQSTFVGVFMGEDLIGFAHVEKVYHFNAIFLNDDHRHEHLAEAVFDTIDEMVPEGYPLLILPDKDVGKLIGKYGFRKLPAETVWRKDY